MMQLLWVSFGGALGSGLRFIVTKVAEHLLGPSFPYGTLIVNGVGSFAMGLLLFLGQRAGVVSPMLRIALTTGLLGGFTTFSSFSGETVQLLHRGAYGVAGFYIVTTVALCIIATIGGYALALNLCTP